jgi:hypothetical protein
MSAKALAYADDLDFRHAFIVLFEDAGLGEDAEYLMRSLLTERCLKYLTVDKTAHGLKSRLITQPGPTGLVTTMTKALTREDNETRAWSLYMDDSKEHTLRVVKRQAQAATGDTTAPDTAPWQALQGLLEPTAVVIPWAQTVAGLLETEALPRDITRLRRDFPRLLTLVKVITLLYQRQRTQDPAGRLIATLDDYAMAYALVAEPFTRSAYGISRRALEVAEAVQAVYEDKHANAKKDTEVYVTVKELAKHLRWATRTVQKWVEQAESGDLIDVQHGGPGTPLKLRPGPEDTTASLGLLPAPETVAAAVQVSLTAIHPLTGVCMSPVRACALGLENPVTPTISELPSQCEARTDPAHRARALPEDDGSPVKIEACEDAHPMRTSALSPEASPESAAFQESLCPGPETAHGVNPTTTSSSADSVRGMRGHAHSPMLASADDISRNGHSDADRARTHGRETSPAKRPRAVTVGDWVWLLSADGVQQNADPYQVTTVEQGPDGHWYARFRESETGWLVEQCEHAPPSPVLPDAEDALDEDPKAALERLRREDPDEYFETIFEGMQDTQEDWHMQELMTPIPGASAPVNGSQTPVQRCPQGGTHSWIKRADDRLCVRCMATTSLVDA